VQYPVPDEKTLCCTLNREDSISSLHVNIVYKTIVEFMSIEGVNSTSSLVSNLWLKCLFTNVSCEFY
jgi:hypothetical protein